MNDWLAAIDATPQAFAGLCLVVLFFIYAISRYWSTHSDKHYVKKSIGYQALLQQVDESLETGRPICVSLGAVDSGASMSETMAGLELAEQLAARAAEGDGALSIATGNAVAYVAVCGITRRAYKHSLRRLGEIDKDSAYIAPTGMGLAAGVDLLRGRQGIQALALYGQTRQEGFWLAEEGCSEAIRQTGGSTDPSSAALMNVPLDHCLVGEEMFVAKSYLASDKGCDTLRVQDWLRTSIILVIIVGVAIITFF